MRLFVPFSRRLQQRFDFEIKNLKDLEHNFLAKVCFHVSSEGELEQVLPIVLKYLRKEEAVEIIYTSPSLELKIEQLKHEYFMLKTLRMPLLLSSHEAMSLEKWVTAPVFYMCRYDFFPSLMLLGFKIKNSHGSFGLIWASLKNKEFIFNSKNFLKKWYFKNIYNSFNLLIAPNEVERRNLEIIGVENENLRVGEFRILQIKERISKASNQLHTTIKHFDSFLSHLEFCSKNDRIILGSAWENDLELFESLELQDGLNKGEKICALVAHDLSPRNLLAIKTKLKTHYKLKAQIFDVDAEFNDIEKGVVLILNMRGVLCELYQYFGHSYVGGGFGRSIHSVLEPFVAGSVVYCGPRVHRSTEYDLIKSIAPKRVVLVDNLKNFYRQMSHETLLDTGALDELSLLTSKTLSVL